MRRSSACSDIGFNSLMNKCAPARFVSRQQLSVRLSVAHRQVNSATTWTPLKHARRRMNHAWYFYFSLRPVLAPSPLHPPPNLRYIRHPNSPLDPPTPILVIPTEAKRSGGPPHLVLARFRAPLYPRTNPTTPFAGITTLALAASPCIATHSASTPPAFPAHIGFTQLSYTSLLNTSTHRPADGSPTRYPHHVVSLKLATTTTSFPCPSTHRWKAITRSASLV